MDSYPTDKFPKRSLVLQGVHICGRRNVFVMLEKQIMPRPGGNEVGHNPLQ